MIAATRADVDQAKKDLADRLTDLACTIRDWRAHPDSTTQRDAARRTLDDAEEAFAEYEKTLTTWAAGPSRAP